MDTLLRRIISGPVLLICAIALFLLLNAGRDEPRLASLQSYTVAISDPQPPPTEEVSPLSAHVVPVTTVEPIAPELISMFASGQVDRATRWIDLRDETEIYTHELDLLAEELQQALDYVVERVDMPPGDRIRVVVGRDASCGFHGVTYSTIRLVRIWSCQGISRQRVVNIAAHEFVHQLSQDYYGPIHLEADLLLSEGIATWGAGRYWLGPRSAFDEFAREYRAMGYTVPLDTSYAEIGTIEGMNALYYQWASFVEFLLRRYGRERFDALYRSGGYKAPGGAAYEAIYDADLRALELQWSRQLEQ